MIEGFHEPVIQAPLRKSGRGGGLAIYINKRVCDFEKIERIDLALDPEDMSGEFQLVKIHNCKGLNKTKVKVNFYRSPSRDTNNFISLLDHVLNRLDRHSRKHVMFFGDANVDLIKYETDSSSQNLIDTLAKYLVRQVLLQLYANFCLCANQTRFLRFYLKTKLYLIVNCRSLRKSSKSHRCHFEKM